MTRPMREIRGEITSNNEAVLRHSLAFVQQRMKEEMDRGRAAETRATAILAVLGILAGLIVPFAETIQFVDETSRPLLYVIFAASLLFLTKGIYYALRILGISKQYRLMPEMAYDFQNGTLVDALKEEIVATIWTHEQAKQPNTTKLFWLHRAQRNGVAAIILYVVFGGSFFVLREELIGLPAWATYLSGVLAVFALLFLDKLAESEKLGGIWSKS